MTHLLIFKICPEPLYIKGLATIAAIIESSVTFAVRHHCSASSGSCALIRCARTNIARSVIADEPQIGAISCVKPLYTRF